jgi:hypothetical protein
VYTKKNFSRNASYFIPHALFGFFLVSLEYRKTPPNAAPVPAARTAKVSDLAKMKNRA